jgi:4'-phosphopantetheinyl transferase
MKPAGGHDRAPPARVDCYRLDLSRSDPRDLALLDENESRRAARFHFERDRSRFVAAHAQVRRLIGRHLGVDPAALRFTTTRHGKPILEGDGQALAFNLTHSGTVGYLAIASFNVGIDVEQHRPFHDLQPLIDDYCSAAEITSLAALPASERVAAFLGVWTRKEAALKAWGTGIGAVPLDSLHVGLAVGLAAGLATSTAACLVNPPASPGSAPDALPGIIHDGIAYPELRLLTLPGQQEVLSIAVACTAPLAVRLDGKVLAPVPS